MVACSLCGWSVLAFLFILGIAYAVFRGSRRLLRHHPGTITRNVTLGAAAAGIIVFAVLFVLAYHAFTYPGVPLLGVWRNAIVGTWAPPPAGPQRTSDEDFGRFSRTFVFHADGSFEMAPTDGIRHSCDPTETSSGCTGIGVWAIESNNNDWWIRLSFVERDGRPVGGSVSHRIGKLLPPYLIYSWIRDPDSGDIIYLTKVKTHNE
jgi:hypothetical protein